MKSELRIKFLQNLNQKKKDEGFTLLELLVVIIIVGILAAIALPSFFTHINKAREAEAIEYIGIMNRAQQVYYTEHATFTSNIAELALGINSQTTNYKYIISNIASNPVLGVTNQAQPMITDTSIKAYIGGVNLNTVMVNEAASLTILCKANQAIGVSGAPTGNETIVYNANGPTCPNNYSPVH